MDYFMHKAFEDVYSQEYDSFDEYYGTWYASFYDWWTHGQHVAH